MLVVLHYLHDTRCKKKFNYNCICKTYARSILSVPFFPDTVYNIINIVNLNNII